ncbi:iron chaperone [Xylanimonas sp. McL0601]|uniref:iron chaperone n=1 Tax=Xylanimonas sp. McL0601 TaxID=3414739 RepID=UPI003CFA6E1C
MGDVSEYLSSIGGAEHDAVARVLERAPALVPDVEEGRSYGMPALRYRGSPLLSVMVTKNHLGLYPFSPAVLEALAGDLTAFRTTKGSVSFQPDAPLPDDVVDRIVLARRDEIDARQRS